MQGKLLLDEQNPSVSSLEASIDVKSLETDDKGLLDKLMGDDFFAADKNPQLVFKSTSVDRLGEHGSEGPRRFDDSRGQPALHPRRRRTGHCQQPFLEETGQVSARPRRAQSR